MGGLGRDREREREGMRQGSLGLHRLRPFRLWVASDSFHRALAQRGAFNCVLRLLACPIGYRNFRHRLAQELTGI